MIFHKFEQFFVENKEIFLFCNFVIFLFIVQSCIEVLKEILTQDEYNLVLAKYFAKLHNESTLSQTTATEWEIFIQMSLKLFGFPESSIKSLKVHTSILH